MMHLNNQRGHLLLLTMVVLAIVSLSAATGLYISYNTRTDSLLSRDRMQAYYIADAGIELALAKLQQEADWNKWIPGTNKSVIAEPKTFADGVIKSLTVKTLSKTKTATEIKLKIEITTKGVFQQAQKTLVVTAELIREGPETKIKITSWKELYPVFV